MKIPSGIDAPPASPEAPEDIAPFPSNSSKQEKNDSFYHRPAKMSPRWLVIDNPEELKVLKQHTLDWMSDLLKNQDPGAISYGFADILQAWKEGRDPILRDAPGLILLHAPAQYPSGLVDSVIAATTFELVAATMKLGTCWAGYFMGAAKNWEPLRRSLNLPDGQILTVALMLGHPKYTYSGLPQRKKPLITWR